MADYRNVQTVISENNLWFSKVEKIFVAGRVKNYGDNQ
jgi:hypothetical protein